MSVPSERWDFRRALGALPLFPLPEAVLFPNVLLPLHVFEPRYRKMIADVLDTHRTLAVVRIASTSPDLVHPEIDLVAGVGTVIDHAELPSGRFNILLRGRARVRLKELPFVSPYRRAEAELMPESTDTVSAEEVAGLVSCASAFVELMKQRDPAFECRFPRDGGDPGALADACAAQLLLDSADRQQVLEATSATERVRLVTEALTLQRVALQSDSRNVN